MSDLPEDYEDEDEDEDGLPLDLEAEPLEPVDAFDYDWGGDGSDLMRPVRAHVLQTLRVETDPYTPPVSVLLTLGDGREVQVAEQFPTLGLTQDHVPELIRMARDRILYTSDSDSLKVWAPLHATRALRHLDASSRAADLIPLFDLQDDWLYTELPEVFGAMGVPALEALASYLADQSRWYTGRAIACEALQELAKQHPELREQVIDILSTIVVKAEHEHITTSAMGTLADLKAVETLPLIRAAFEQGQIDEIIYGPWGEVLKMMDLTPDDNDPLIAESRKRFEERHERFMPRAKREELLGSLKQLAERRLAEQERARLAADRRKATENRRRSEKNKRKASSAARKANRKKR